MDCPITDEVKVVSVRFLYYKVTIFPFVINKKFVGGILRQCTYPISH